MPDSDEASDAGYRKAADAVFARIESTIDRWLQDDVVDIDAQRTGGLLELVFAEGARIVVNTQPPLREIWLAAKSGGFHFRLDGAKWLDRNREEFFAVLSREASTQAGQPLTFEAQR